MDPFWENLAYSLLEYNLNGDTLNAQILKDLFKEKPNILETMDFGDGIGITGLDEHMYKGKPDVVEVREAKAHELFECIPCGRVFRRRDNLDRHLRTGLHGRRKAAYDEAERRKRAEREEAEAARVKTSITV